MCRPGLFRISFSGELAYEIAVPAGYGDSLVRALVEAGEPFGAVMYGTEALSVMRIEKGHAAGNELNGQTVARDLGLGRMMSGKKDFVGRIMAERPALVDPARPTLVGLRPIDPAERLRAGAHLLCPGAVPGPANRRGLCHVRRLQSLARTLDRARSAARGPERIGERIRVYDPVRRGDIEAEIVAPVFIDPEGVRLRG